MNSSVFLGHRFGSEQWNIAEMIDVAVQSVYACFCLLLFAGAAARIVDKILTHDHM